MNRNFNIVVRLALAAIFLYSGSLSSRSPEEFSDNIAGYRLLPEFAIVPLALTLPPLEMLVGLFLIIGRPQRMATFSALVLTSMFIIALGSALARGLVIDCGCFGTGTPSRMKMWLALGRDVLLGGALAALYWSEYRKTAVSETGQPAEAQGINQESAAKPGSGFGNSIRKRFF